MEAGVRGPEEIVARNQSAHRSWATKIANVEREQFHRIQVRKRPLGSTWSVDLGGLLDERRIQT